jgi:hypothetical protein
MPEPERYELTLTAEARRFTWTCIGAAALGLYSYLFVEPGFLPGFLLALGVVSINIGMRRP